MTKHEWEKTQAVLRMRGVVDWRRSHQLDTSPDAIEAKVRAYYPALNEDDVAYVTAYADRKRRE